MQVILDEMIPEEFSPEKAIPGGFVQTHRL